jgi:signal transduction histidine kinase/CheY-like chemotaxis protein
MEENESLKKLKEELSLLNEKLKISQSLIKVGFWEYSLISKQIILSDEALAILQLKRNNPAISIEEFAKIMGEDLRTGIYQKVIRFESGFEDLDFEFILKPSTPDAETWIKVIASHSAYSSKNHNTIIGIVQDISEQKKNEKILKRAKEKAEEADFLKSAFLANMSHEIRTPLNAILGFSKLLTNPGILESQRNEYSVYITSSANNLLNLINDIVDVSQIEAGKIHIEKRDCDINLVLKQLKVTFDKEKENQHKNHIEIRLRQNNAFENLMVVTDPYRLHQILVNLIGNALKFIEEGFIEFGYFVLNQNWIQFYVKDTGIGIPDDKMDLIFSRFGQIVNNKIKNPGGTGLGLSITKHLVERLGGKIWVESSYGSGTTFNFTLPNIPAQMQDENEKKTNNAIKTFEISNIKILAVEDDKINMILLEDVLKLHVKNLSLIKAFNGLDALDKYNESDVDLIIMDIRMPYMDGYEATFKIRHDFPFPKNQVPILGLSAHALIEEIEKGKEIGMTDFLSKPIIPEDLLLKISQIIEGIDPASNKENSNSVIRINKGNSHELDIRFLENLFMGNTEKIQKTLKVYISQIPQQFNQLAEAFENRNFESFKTLAHSLKSTFKYLNRQDLSDLAKKLEIDLDPNNDREAILENLEKLKSEWEGIEKQIIQKFLS